MIPSQGMFWKRYGLERMIAKRTLTRTRKPTTMGGRGEVRRPGGQNGQTTFHGRMNGWS